MSSKKPQSARIPKDKARQPCMPTVDVTFGGVRPWFAQNPVVTIKAPEIRLSELNGSNIRWCV